MIPVPSYSEVYRITRRWFVLRSAKEAHLLSFSDLRLTFPLREGPDSPLVCGPVDLGTPEQVPEEYRDAFLRWYQEADGALALSLPMDPWVPLDPSLWEGFQAPREEQTRRWDTRMEALGLGPAWGRIKSALRSGCLEEEDLLTLLLQGQPSGRTLSPALQVLGTALGGWLERLGERGTLPAWSKRAGFSAEWDGPHLWGELRSALASQERASALLVLEGVRKASRALSGAEARSWGVLLNQMLDYARPSLLPELIKVPEEELNRLGFRGLVQLLNQPEGSAP